MLFFEDEEYATAEEDFRLGVVAIAFCERAATAVEDENEEGAVATWAL